MKQATRWGEDLAVPFTLRHGTGTTLRPILSPTLLAQLSKRHGSKNSQSYTLKFFLNFTFLKPALNYSYITATYYHYAQVICTQRFRAHSQALYQLSNP